MTRGYEQMVFAGPQIGAGGVSAPPALNPNLMSRTITDGVPGCVVDGYAKAGARGVLNDKEADVGISSQVAAEIEAERKVGAVDVALMQSQSSRTGFVLASLRCTSLRAKLIENELTAIGLAFKGGLISPDVALECAEEVAPGCIGFIPVAACRSWGALW
jgi:hypothetical protein